MLLSFLSLFHPLLWMRPVYVNNLIFFWPCITV
jgi:hypothetical protein